MEYSKILRKSELAIQVINELNKSLISSENDIEYLKSIELVATSGDQSTAIRAGIMQSGAIVRRNEKLIENMKKLLDKYEKEEDMATNQKAIQPKVEEKKGKHANN